MKSEGERQEKERKGRDMKKIEKKLKQQKNAKKNFV